MLKRESGALILAGTLCMILFFSAVLSGCAGKTADHGNGSTADRSTGSTADGESSGESGFGTAGGSVSRLEIFADMEKQMLEDSWKVTTPDGRQVEIAVEARTRIKYKEAGMMSVTEVCEPEFDAAYKKQVISAVFGVTDIYSYEPDKLPKNDLLSAMDEIERKLLLLDALSADDDVRKEIGKLKDEFDAMNGYLKNAGSDYVLIDNYDGESFMGYIDGVRYRLDFTEDENNGIRFKKILFGPVDARDAAPEEIRGMTLDGLILEACEYTRDSNGCPVKPWGLERTAADFLNAADASFFVREDFLGIGWWERDVYDGRVPGDKAAEYGYCFGGVTGTPNGMINDGDSYDGWYANDGHGYSRYSDNGYASVYVTDRGVIKAEIDNPLCILSQTESVGLLPFDVIFEIMKDELSKNPFDYTLNKDAAVINFDSLCLDYYRVSDERVKGKYCFVPVWKLSHEYRDNLALHENLIIINAIDGTVIKVR